MAADVTAETLAKLFELTERRVQQLASDGIIPRAGRGAYPLMDSVRGYLRYLKERAEGRSAGNDLDAAKLARLELDVRLAQVELAKAEGEVIPVADHLEVLGRIVDGFRTKLVSLEGSWGPRVVGITSPAEGAAVVGAMVREAIEDLRSIADDLELHDPERPLPEDFPGYRHLAAAGVMTYAELQRLDDVTELRGIGPRTRERIEELVA